MTQRQEKILKAIIEEHLTDAQPVGSKILGEKYNFGIGPAMIRQEMAVLAEEDYLDQPHYSAGRVPTAKAYRFYIGKEIKKSPQTLEPHDQRALEKAVRAGEGAREDILREITRATAEISSDLSVVGLVGEDLFFTHGFARLAREPELQDKSSIQSLLEFMDELDDRVGLLWQHVASDETEVFVGEENPIRDLRKFSLITGRFNLSARDEVGQVSGFISLIGPRRMNYPKNIALVNYVSELIAGLKI